MKSLLLPFLLCSVQAFITPPSPLQGQAYNHQTHHHRHDDHCRIVGVIPSALQTRTVFVADARRRRAVTFGWWSLSAATTPLDADSTDTETTSTTTTTTTTTTTGTASSSFSTSDPTNKQSGLYRPFMEYAWNKLEQAGVLLPSLSLSASSSSSSSLNNTSLVPPELTGNTAIAKGMPTGTLVKISIDAKHGNNHKNSNHRSGDDGGATTTGISSTPMPIQYGRYALLETLLPEMDTTNTGIQVLNLVVFGIPPLPVWGVDLVSLPGGRHLLLMDVQPMVVKSSSSDADATIATMDAMIQDKYEKWHETHVQNTFEWGGDLPEAAAKFFSPHALWTRLSGEDAIQTIQTLVFDAFASHLDLYLECVASYASIRNGTGSSSSSYPQTNPVCENHQAQYLDYRLTNDPARPMLQSLYGPEWTERLLEEVLFNKELAVP